MVFDMAIPCSHSARRNFWTYISDFIIKLYQIVQYPITPIMFVDPVLCGDETAYSRAGILHWLHKESLSSIIREPMSSNLLTNNNVAKKLVYLFQECNVE